MFNCYFSLPADFCWTILDREFLLKHIKGVYRFFQVHLVATREGFGILLACRLQIYLPCTLMLTKLWKWTNLQKPTRKKSCQVFTTTTKNEVPFCGIRRLLKSHSIDTKQLAQGHKIGGNVPSTYCPFNPKSSNNDSHSQFKVQLPAPVFEEKSQAWDRQLHNRNLRLDSGNAGNGRKSSIVIKTLRFKVPC